MHSFLQIRYYSFITRETDGGVQAPIVRNEGWEFILFPGEQHTRIKPGLVTFLPDSTAEILVDTTLSREFDKTMYMPIINVR